MGIDYDGVGGIGIELTEELVQRFIAAEYFTEEEWQDDYEDCLETIVPEDLLESSDDINLVNNAIEVLKDFRESLEEIVEEM